MTIETSTIAELVLGLVVAAVGWLLSRSIRGVDDKIDVLGKKVDALGTADNAHSNQIVQLFERVAQLQNVDRRQDEEIESLRKRQHELTSITAPLWTKRGPKGGI